MYAAIGLLLAAVATEVAATAALPRTQGFRDPVWSVVVILGYAASIWLLALVVRQMPVSTAYALWAGLGTAAVAVIGAVWLGESLTPLKVAALGMIITGVVVLNLHAPTDPPGSSGAVQRENGRESSVGVYGEARQEERPIGSPGQPSHLQQRF